MAIETRYYLYDAARGQELLARVDDLAQGIAFLFRDGEWHPSKYVAELVTGMGGDTGYTDISEAEARRQFPEAFVGSPVTFDRDLFARALDFAARVHGDQKVPGSKFPYVVHVAKVAMEVLAATEGEAGTDRNLALVCALLHDTVEDAKPQDRPWVIAGIATTFGIAVQAGVMALTKDKYIPEELRMSAALVAIQKQPREVWLVKLADRITNLEPPPPEWGIEKRQHYLAEAKVILQSLGDASSSLRRRLEEKLVKYETHCR